MTPATTLTPEPLPSAGTTLSATDRLGTLRIRSGIGRDRYAVDPGLYRIGEPGRDAPVLVTANYKLTFDHVRTHLAGLRAWLLVLDTKGVNVWCAAGKNTFGTVELSRRVVETNLAQIVDHRTLIVPQLGATGVAAHDVESFTGFRVVYGPVRAADIREFLAHDMKATEQMRCVTFTTAERLILLPVELSNFLRARTLLVLAALFALSGLGIWGYSADALVARGSALIVAALVGAVAGAVVVPIALPWIPGRAFSVKGGVVGAIGAATLISVVRPQVGLVAASALALGAVAISSYLAMSFTGATTFTSPSGVEHEMRRALPWQVGAAGLAVVLWVGSAFLGRGW